MRKSLLFLIAVKSHTLCSMEEVPVQKPVNWELALEESISKCKTQRLITLISQEPSPENATRGLGFKPYTNALTRVEFRKDREIRILTNKPLADAKHCTCFNGRYVWYHHVTPILIIAMKISQLGFASWAIARAANNALEQNPNDVHAALKRAAPGIGALIASCCDIPFSLINAWRNYILKVNQSKYEYYVLAEHMLNKHATLEELIKENQADINELLNRRKQTIDEQHSNE